jgi:hypothetical protein
LKDSRSKKELAIYRYMMTNRRIKRNRRNVTKCSKEQREGRNERGTIQWGGMRTIVENWKDAVEGTINI